MKVNRTSCIRKYGEFVLTAGLVLGASAARAVDVTYEVRDLHFIGPAGQNGLPLALDIVESGVVGHFVWSYQAGDFSGGSGRLLDLSLPIASQPFSAWTTRVDTGGLSVAYTGNAQNTTLDVKIGFLAPLSAQGGARAIDPSSSSFDLTGSYQGSSPLVEWTGSIVGGTVSPVAEPAAPWLMIAGLLLVVRSWQRQDRPVGRLAPAFDE